MRKRTVSLISPTQSKQALGAERGAEVPVRMGWAARCCARYVETTQHVIAQWAE